MLAATLTFSCEEGVPVAGPRLRVLEGRAVQPEVISRDPVVFQTACVEAFVASWTAHGFSLVTIENDTALLERMLTALGRPAWEVTAEDIDRVVGDLATAGRAGSTRRDYAQTFKMFHRFLQARKAAEIEAAFGVRLVCPVDEFTPPVTWVMIRRRRCRRRHRSGWASSSSSSRPGSPLRVSTRRRRGTTRCSGPSIIPGSRSEEASLLERVDVHFGRGPFGKLHVRFGKGARTSGPRPRWVPMLDGLDLNGDQVGPTKPGTSARRAEGGANQIR
jgi:hypothetical protein